MTVKSFPADGLPSVVARTAVALAFASAVVAFAVPAQAHAARGDRGSAVSAEAADLSARPAGIETFASPAAMSPLLEQHTRRGGSGGGGSSSGGGGGQAVPRGGSSGSGGSSAGGSSGGSRGGDSTAGGRSGSDQGASSGGSREGARTRDSGEGSRSGSGDTPTYSRPRDGRPATGTAVQRQRGDGRPIIIDRGGYYPGWYPWGWGGIGLGGYYGYYDPWWGWYDPYPPPIAYGGYDGALRIKVKPRDAEVYVDGYYAGQVDDYDGMFQKLRLEPGPHRIEVRLEGYEPLTFEVRIQPDRTITYKGELQRN